MSENKGICSVCGIKNGKRIPLAPHLEFGRCDWCGQQKVVSDPKGYKIPDSKQEEESDAD